MFLLKKSLNFSIIVVQLLYHTENLNGKLFGYEIKYNQVEGEQTPDPLDTGLKVLPKYNGNIAEVDWRTNTVSGDYLRRYGYVYDKLNRLSAGFYQRDDHPSANEYFEKITYDLNGNISGLQRTASLAGNTTAGLIDNLTYQYFNNNNSNRLRTVTDSSTDYRGYPDTSGIEIGYDNNGNMTSQQDKGILQIDYNFLNLPTYIKFNQYISRRGQLYYVNTRYKYRADGVKLNKAHNYFVKSVSNISSTDYLDGFQYTNINSFLDISGEFPMALRFVPTSEGYYNFENNKYIYNYVDHLGNVRLSYFNNGSSIEILEENNYYPFGLKHEGYNTLAGNSAYHYKYNGKELQTETGMYDYGARFYMPDIGRWGVVDPLAEKMRRYSPYNYAFNNPIRFIDPDGRSGKDVIITGEHKNEVLAELQSSVEGQLILKMDEAGKVTAEAVEGAKLTKASSTFLKATEDVCNIVVLKSDGDYRLDNGTFYQGGAYGGNKMAGNGKMIGVNVVNPMVNKKLDEILDLPNGVGTLHEALENYMGILNSPGSPAASSPENNAKGYTAAHKKAKELDPRFKDPGSDFTGKDFREKRTDDNGRRYFTEEYIYTNSKTKEKTSLGRFKTYIQ